jgi:hypothetical protein
LGGALFIFFWCLKSSADSVLFIRLKNLVPQKPHTPVLTSHMLVTLYGSSNTVVLLQGPQALAAKVTFPDDEELLNKTVIVGNLSPLVNIDQVESLPSRLAEAGKCKDMFPALGLKVGCSRMSTGFPGKRCCTIFHALHAQGCTGSRIDLLG